MNNGVHLGNHGAKITTLNDFLCLLLPPNLLQNKGDLGDADCLVLTWETFSLANNTFWIAAMLRKKKNKKYEPNPPKSC